MIAFTQHPGLDYWKDYNKFFAAMSKLKPADQIPYYRAMVYSDLFFIVYFVMGVEAANCKFVVDRCREVQDGAATNTLDIWARDHFKSTIITVAETIQTVLKDPEKCVGIFSYVRPVAKKFLAAIKNEFEMNTMLQSWFPDVLWGDNPSARAPKWSEDDGIILKRRGNSRKESTIEAHGLIEGMPTSRHFDVLKFDDALETPDLVENPELMAKAFRRYEDAQFLGSARSTRRVIGTFHHHSGGYKMLQEKKGEDGSPVYLTRIHPGAVDGKPVMLSEEKLAEWKQLSSYQTQILCDPTPKGFEVLKSDMLTEVHRRFIPADILRFMVIDPAGDSGSQSGKDNWAMGVFGVKPAIDDLGLSEVYILDLEIDKMKHEEAIERATRMYIRNPWIMRVAIEKMGQSTAEVHIQNALRSQGKHISIEGESLQILKANNRNKIKRIEAAIAWPLNNGKWKYSADVNPAAIIQLKTEMEKFGFWKDDGLDICAYLYDVIKGFRWDSMGQEMKPLQYRRRGIM